MRQTVDEKLPGNIEVQVMPRFRKPDCIRKITEPMRLLLGKSPKQYVLAFRLVGEERFQEEAGIRMHKAASRRTGCLRRHVRREVQ